VTIEELEHEERLDNEEDDPEIMASVAHYFMMHYAEKESINKKRKKKCKPKAGQYSLEARLKHFEKRGETTVSKELKKTMIMLYSNPYMWINYPTKKSQRR
jgi:hypothetical protein